MDSRRSELRRLVALAQAQGWTVDDSKSGHVLFTPTNKEWPRISSSTTPSDHRALKNLRSQLRRAGLRDERQKKKPEGAPPVINTREPIEPPSLPEVSTQGACEAAIYLKIFVPERVIETPVELTALADVDLLALLHGAQAELLRRSKQ